MFVCFIVFYCELTFLFLTDSLGCGNILTGPWCAPRGSRNRSRETCFHSTSLGSSHRLVCLTLHLLIPGDNVEVFFFFLGKKVILSSSRGSDELPCCFPETVNWRFCPSLPPQPGHLMSGPFRVPVEWQIVQYALCFEWSFLLCRWQRRGVWSPGSGLWAGSESNAFPGHFHKSPPTCPSGFAF